MDGNPMRIALCEDDNEQRGITLSLLEEYRNRSQTGFTVQAFSSGKELLSESEKRGFDLYLLDILMPGEDGIALARKLREKDADTPFIFLTASADYALDAFTVSAFQYLLKPIDPKAFFAALEKAAAGYTRDKEAYIVVQAAEGAFRVPFSDIIYVELSGRNLCFTLQNGETLTSRSVRVPFAQAVAPLIEDSRFLYAHKSFLINMARVRSLRARAFEMENGCEIPIPRNKYAAAKNRYFDYLSARGIGVVNHAR